MPAGAERLAGLPIQHYADAGIPGMGDPTPEAHEKLPYAGKRALVLGGTSGIGRAFAEVLVAGGADSVHIGSRSEESVGKTITELRPMRASAEQAISSFAVDLADHYAVRKKASTLIGAEAINLIVMGPARGADLIADTLQEGLTPIRQAKTQEEKDILRGALREKLRVEVADPEKIAAAKRLNVDGYEALFGRMIMYMPEGSIVVNIPSTKSAKRKGKDVFYELVENSKGEEQDIMDEAAERMAEIGIYTVNIIPHIVTDTQTGRLIRVMIRSVIADKKEQEQIMSWGVATADVAEGFKMVLETDPKTWDTHPLNMYIIGSGDPENPGAQYLADLPDDHPAVNASLL